MSELNLCTNYLNQLNHPNAKTREQAADNFRIRDCKTPGMLEKLIKALGDKSDRVRMYVRFRLVKMREKAIPALVKSLSHPNKIVRKEAVDCLSSMKHLAISAIPYLRNLAAKDPDHILRFYAEEAIKEILNSQVKSPRLKPRIRKSPPKRLRTRIRLRIKKRIRKTWKRPYTAAQRFFRIYPPARKAVLPQPKIGPIKKLVKENSTKVLAPKYPATDPTTRITTVIVPPRILTTQRPDKKSTLLTYISSRKFLEKPRTFSPPINSSPIRWEDFVKPFQFKINLESLLEYRRGSAEGYNDKMPWCDLILGIALRSDLAYNIMILPKEQKNKYVIAPTIFTKVSLGYSASIPAWEMREGKLYGLYSPRLDLTLGTGVEFFISTVSLFIGVGIHMKPGINEKKEFGIYPFPTIEGRLSFLPKKFGVSSYFFLSDRGVDGFGVGFTWQAI